MGIFQRGLFIFSSGRRSDWKVEIDKADDEDIKTLALRGIEKLDGFSKVIPVPKGKSGSPIDNAKRIAEVLQPFAEPDNEHLPVLVVDDVYTTGDSINAEMKLHGYNVMGLVLFAHAKPPPWINAVWILGV